MRVCKGVLLAVALALGFGLVTDAQITVPTTFTAGTTISPDEVNTNFSTLGNTSLNRTGGTITGTVTVSGGVTIDGVDISTLGPSGTPTFAGVTVTGSGASAIDVTGGINAGSGNVGIVDTTGKIPALSATYFASLSGANVTSLPAAQLTGSVPVANIDSLTTVDFLTQGVAQWTNDANYADKDLANTFIAGQTFSSTVALNGPTTATAEVDLQHVVKYSTVATHTTVGVNETASVGNVSVLRVTTTGASQSLQTINTGVQGRRIYLVVAGTNGLLLVTGGNIATSSPTLSVGVMVVLIYDNGTWHYN